MKVKLAILESDKNYLNRIATVFTNKFADKLEIYSYADENIAMSSLHSSKIDVFISCTDFDIDIKGIPQGCGFAYLVDTPNTGMHKEQKAIFKFQKAESIYREILSILNQAAGAAGAAGNAGGADRGDGTGETKIIGFVSASGGAGSSTLAAACAMAIARKGRSVLYLNIEAFGTSNIFFKGQGQFDFGDVLYAIKNNKPSLALKLESTVKQDECGVYFYDPAQIALDVTGMSTGEFEHLLNLTIEAQYNYIIMDMDFSPHETCIDKLKHMQQLVFVSDGSEIANAKLKKAVAALMTLDVQNRTSLCHCVAMIYNKFDSQTSQVIEDPMVTVLGGVSKHEQMTARQVVEKIADMSLFDRLI
ncbi:MAG: chromosome partitioning protein ParA [Peptococcaceae bacterium]|nr:chromosome partitioning protein ParA [Peptococcaceae bacterium]